MTANEIQLLKLLHAPRHFTIPIYQRPYSWSLEECSKLFDDILRVGLDSTRRSYFMGAVVYYQPSAHAIGPVPESQVIDGQQRLTTSILLLTAIYRLLKEQGELIPAVSSEELRVQYLINQFKTGELAQRLLLTKRDRETMIAIVNSVPLPANSSERVRENFAYFRRQINADNAAGLWAGISKLMVVGVALEAGIDNPQLIFESLNSTGRPLDQADLIRNYVLMGQTPTAQDALYKGYWYPMEEAFGEDYGWMFREFMRDFLTMKLGRLVGIDTVYQSFKNEYAAGCTTAACIEELAHELYQHATYYVRLRQPEKEVHPELRQALQQLRDFGATVAYPYLLDAYAASEKELLSKQELGEVVHMVERYVVRRAICGIPTNTLNSTFMNFGTHLDPDNYLESVKQKFLELGYNRRFPLDDEFREQLVNRDTYHTIRTRKHLLKHLANYQQKEYVNIDEYTVEHIMPQNENVSEAWKAELGPEWKEVHSRYLHTIGNLTLTGYNSELSDRPFSEKKTMPGGFLTSPIKLNQSVAAEPVWNMAAILQRANLLADWAIAIWPVPVVTTSIIVSKEQVDEQVEEEALAEAGLFLDQED